MKPRFRIRAPFEVAASYTGHLELFSYRLMQVWFDDFQWDYWFSQHLGPLPRRRK